MAEEDKSAIFRGIKTVPGVVPTSLNPNNNQDQTNVCNRFF